jgi:putative transposase
VKRKRFSVEQIVAVLKQAEAGVPVAELIRQVEITEQTWMTRPKMRESTTRIQSNRGRR